MIKKLFTLFLILVLSMSLSSCALTQDKDAQLNKQESKDYKLLTSIYDKSELFTPLYTKKNNIICVSDDNNIDDFKIDNPNGAIGLFDLSDKSCLKSYDIYNTLYPASLTKLLVSYIILTNCNLDDVVTVSEQAVDLDVESQSLNLIAGDRLTVNDVLNGLLVYSGNDASTILAEYYSGSKEAFTQVMNEELIKLGATSTHFTNPSGLHDYNHYSCAYDIYLLFNKCLQIDKFREMINQSFYECNVLHANGMEETYRWESTNFYFNGNADFPEGFTCLGGKTGTTDEAGSCLIIFFKDKNDKDYISILMNCPSKEVLYDEMTRLIKSTNNK